MPDFLHELITSADYKGLEAALLFNKQLSNSF
jgi:hypothetical protein